MFNLSTVIRFEVVRALKKKSFWVMAISFPLLMGAIFGIIYLSNMSTSAASKDLEKQKFSVEVTDNSGLVSPQLLANFGAKTVPDKQQGIDNVKNGKVDSYIYYPADLTKEKIEVYGKNVDIFQNGRYEGVASTLLSTSVLPTVTPEVATVLQNKAATSTTIFRDGAVYEPFKEMIFPAVFLVLFYLLIAFFGSQMLTSTTEEKENRVIEMILTTIEARTLIVGKIISLVALAFLQGALMILPVVVGYLLLHNQLNLPSIDLSTIPVNWGRIGVSAAIFVASFTLFTGLLVLVGSAVPTAKEAGQFFGLVMTLLFGPLYAVTLFVSSPDSPIVHFLSLFPLTAPIPLLLRNAVGNLQAWEIAVALPVMAITAVIILALAVRVFRYGALEYSRKVSLKEIFGGH